MRFRPLRTRWSVRFFRRRCTWIGTFVLGSEWWCARFNTIVFLIGLWIMARLLRDRVSTQVRAAFLLLLLACSMFMHHLEGYFAEAFTAMFAGVGLLAVDAGYPLAGWTATIVGVINTPASLVGLGSAAVVHMWNTRRVRHLLPVAVAAAGIMLESWIRRGSPFVTGYEGNHGDTTMLTYSGRPGFSYPFAFGVLSILLSFGKGLLFFAPGLLLHVKNLQAPSFCGSPSWRDSLPCMPNGGRGLADFSGAPASSSSPRCPPRLRSHGGFRG